MSVNDLSLNLWYSGLEHKKTSPLIVELTFNYEAKKLPERNKARLEEFPLSAVQKANNYYISLQNQKIADRITTKTKDEFAYSYKNSN